jgi:hypothetical protein
VNEARKYPPVERKPDYRPTGAAPGHDGAPPVLVEPDRKAKFDKDVALVNRNTNRISLLHHQGAISDVQAEAARRFQKDWELSLIQPAASSVLVGAGGGSQLPNDAKVDAMKRRGAALVALGCDLKRGVFTAGARVLELIVIREMTVKQAAAQFGNKHPQFIIGGLGMALDVLAGHYGLVMRR